MTTLPASTPSYLKRCTRQEKQGKPKMSGELHGEGGGRAERFWEEHYRKQERVWSGKANPVLVDIARPLPPGTGLDLGCGEGGDAVWLAGLGWRVTAVDVSATALDRASTYAAEAGVEDHIDFQQHDLAHTFPAGTSDLVSAQYLQSPVEFPRDHVLQAAARAAAPGGLLLIVTHASVPPWFRAHRNTRFPSPDEELAELELDPSLWQPEFVGAPERQATGPNGETGAVTDNVIAVRRLPQ
jgi:SAM-dependent methyltransferase